MRLKRWIFLSSILLVLQFLNLSKAEWVVADDSGKDDDAIEIHSYQDEYKS